MHGYLKASAPFDLSNPSFEVEAWLRADGHGVLTNRLAPQAEEVRRTLAAFGVLLRVITGGGSVGSVRDLPRKLEDAGVTVPRDVRRMIEVLGDAEDMTADYNLSALTFNRLLQGFSYSYAGQRGGRAPDVCPGFVEDGRCWTVPPEGAFPGIPGIWEPGECTAFEVNGVCYLIPPTSVSFGGICRELGVPSAECSWGGLMARYVRPALRTAFEHLTRTTFSDATLSALIDRLTTGADVDLRRRVRVLPRERRASSRGATSASTWPRRCGCSASRCSSAPRGTSAPAAAAPRRSSAGCCSR